MKLYFIAGFCCLFTLSLSAQNKSETTTRVIIEMEENVNGTITKEKKVLEGDEAIKYLEENKVDEASEDVEIEIEKEVDGVQSINLNDDGETQSYKIVTKENGEEKTIEWDGKGEMPAEMEQIMKDFDVDIETNGDQRTIKITDQSEEGEPEVRRRMKMKTADGKVMEWDGTGEIPAEMKRMMEEEGEHNTFVFKNEKDFMAKDPNKARLGVMIKEENGVVIVDDVIKDSAAEKAGIQSGDHIVKVDDTEIDSMDRLLSEMGTLRPGDKIDIIIKVNGLKEKTLKVQL